MNLFTIFFFKNSFFLGLFCSIFLKIQLRAMDDFWSFWPYVRRCEMISTKDVDFMEHNWIKVVCVGPLPIIAFNLRFRSFGDRFNLWFRSFGNRHSFRSCIGIDLFVYINNKTKTLSDIGDSKQIMTLKLFSPKRGCI